MSTIASNKKMQLINPSAKRLKGRSKFKEGAILRIRCENFLTYDSIEIYPGPNLNMIIGPNGTGKSSVVCAICLGLAGKTSTIGRATHVSEYVKHGCNEAIIEIELYNPDGDNVVIRRVISKNNTTTWNVNQRASNLKSVEELVRKLNIQVGNLCQFLPQDRVADFTKMSPQELLENTQKAVGLVDMHANHCALKEASTKLREMELAFKHSKGFLEKEKQKNSRLHDEVQNYKQQQVLLRELKFLKQKRTWVEYDEVRQAFVDIKKEKEKLLKTLQEKRSVNSPLEKKIRFQKENATKVSKEVQALGNNVLDIGSKIRKCNNKIEDLDDKLVEVQQDLKAKRQDNTQQQKRLKLVQNQLESLKSELENIQVNEEDLQPAIEQVFQKAQEVTRSYSVTQEEKNHAFEDKSRLEREIALNESALKKLEDVNTLKMDVLRKVNKNAYAAAKWLEANEDRFQKKIHGPIMVKLNVKDRKYAKFIEKHISFNDMIAFVCEDPSDMNNFLKYVREEQNLKINAVLMPKENVESFKPRNSISKFKQWGFHSHLKDLFTAPDAVMAYLCKQYNAHEILIGNQWTKDNISTVLEQSGLSYFYTENHQYVVRKSRYGNKCSSTRCTEISGGNLLTHSVDLSRQSELRALNKSLATKKMEQEKIYEILKRDEIRLAAELEELRRKKKDLISKRDHKKSIQVKVSQKCQILKQIENETMNVEEEERKANVKIIEINDKKLLVLEEKQKSMSELILASFRKLDKSLHHGLLLSASLALENELRDANVALQGLEAQCEEITQSVKKKKEEALKLYKLAKQSTESKDYKDLPIEFITEFAKLPTTVAKIDDEIHDQQAQLDCILQTDESVIKEFKRRETEIEKLSRSMKDEEEDLEKYSNDIKKIKEVWLPELKKLIANTNNKFCEYFKELGCAGEIGIQTGDNPEDYSKYGISIKVKYRDNESLQELSAHQQSGGERSVATVLYLLALQEITKCPFRCVDEINQGMDSINERKVFELVVKIACKDDCSQYFLLTPKLLPDLGYSCNMSTLCIFNGSTMMHHNNWNVKKYISRRKRID